MLKSLQSKSLPSECLYFKRRLQCVKYFSQIADLNVDDLRARVELISPDLAEYRFSAHHRPLVEKEECQETGGRRLEQ